MTDHARSQRRLFTRARPEVVGCPRRRHGEIAGIGKRLQLRRHGGAQLAFPGRRRVRQIFGDRRAVGVAIHVEILEGDIAGARRLRGGDQRALQRGEEITPAVIGRAQALIDGGGIAGRRRCEGAIAGIAGSGLDAVGDVRRRAAHRTHRQMALDERIDQGPADRPGAENHMNVALGHFPASPLADKWRVESDMAITGMKGQARELQAIDTAAEKETPGARPGVLSFAPMLLFDRLSSSAIPDGKVVSTFPGIAQWCRSKRSSSITLVHAATKSLTNFFCESSCA